MMLAMCFSYAGGTVFLFPSFGWGAKVQGMKGSCSSLVAVALPLIVLHSSRK